MNAVRNVALSLGLLILVPTARGAYIDAINPDAAIEPRTNFSFPDVGWHYTPAQSYDLDGIFSRFSPFPSGSGSRTITVQIQTDSPADGGVLLAQGTVTGDIATGGVLGVHFSPVHLTAGTSYFVDFLNVSGMGIDVGQWQAVNGVHVASAGATTRLPAYYRDNGDGLFGTVRFGDAADQVNVNGTLSGLEPILYFSGTPSAAVPEPSGVILLGLGAAMIVLRMRRNVAA